MKIAVHILAYNVTRFIQAVLENALPHVDKIYIAYPNRPWGYVQDSRDTGANPTTLADIKQAASSDKIEIVQGDWDTEEAMRNACLQKAKAEGYDWFLIQDADEFYTDATWTNIKDYLASNIENDLLITTWYNFWKSAHYVVTYPNGSIKGTNAGFALRCASDIHFTSKRLTNARAPKIIDFVCYHYGYVMSDEQMHEKLKTWGHAKEVNTPAWFLHKWKNWDDTTEFLHPTNPIHWHKAIRFPLEQPPFAEQFALNLHTPKKKIRDRMGAWYYNTKVAINKEIYSYKQLIKSILS